MTVSSTEVMVAIAVLLVPLAFSLTALGYYFADFHKGVRMTKKKELEDQIEVMGSSIDSYDAELELCKAQELKLTALIAQLKIDNINLKVSLCKLASACYRTAQDLGGLADIYKPEAR
jgi:hypothetical protein